MMGSEFSEKANSRRLDTLEARQFEITESEKDIKDVAEE